MRKGTIVAVLLTLFVLLIIVKILVGDFYFIPTGSMESTIKSGSTVWVWKLPYGAKLPRNTSEIPYLSTLFRLFGECPLWANSRMPATSEIERGDMCLAQFDHIKIVKRVIALPGDTVEIVNGLVLVNLQPEVIKPTYRFVYVARLGEAQVKSIPYLSAQYVQQDGYELTVEGTTLEHLKNEDNLARAKFYAQDTSEAEGTFPKGMRGVWTRNDFGPFVLPHVGMSIPLDSMSYRLYRETIEKHEGVMLRQTADGIMVNDILQATFRFNNDYYFLMGDNRMEAIDSRFLGLFPTKYLLGRIND